jgi:hypothetical protein
MAAAKIRRAQRKLLEAKLKQSAAEILNPAPVAAEMVSAARE